MITIRRHWCALWLTTSRLVACPLFFGRHSIYDPEQPIVEYFTSQIDRSMALNFTKMAAHPFWRLQTTRKVRSFVIYRADEPVRVLTQQPTGTLKTFASRTAFSMDRASSCTQVTTCVKSALLARPQISLAHCHCAQVPVWSSRTVPSGASGARPSA